MGLTVNQQVADLKEGRLLRQLLDRVAAVAQDAILAVEFGDGAVGARRGGEAGVVEPDAGSSLRHSAASTPPLSIGMPSDSPVRLSVMVMLSATVLPLSTSLAERPNEGAGRGDEGSRFRPNSAPRTRELRPK